VGSLRPARAAANSQSYEDESGDSGQAPDVVGIQVSNDDRGTIAFTITFANRPALQEHDLVAIVFDIDLLKERQKATGYNGADYAFFEDVNGGTVGRWNGSYFGAYPTPTSSSSYANGVLTFQINRSDIGNPEDFLGFHVLTSADDGNTVDEDAPDTFLPGGWPVFEIMVSNPGATPKLIGKLTVGRAVSGTLLTATLEYKRSDSAAPTTSPLSGKTFACTARVSGKVLRASLQESAGAVVRCGWPLPKGSAGKRVAGSVSVAFSSAPWAKLTRRFSRKIG
jgi:hypothetical protein